MREGQEVRTIFCICPYHIKLELKEPCTSSKEYGTSLNPEQREYNESAGLGFYILHTTFKILFYVCI